MDSTPKFTWAANGLIEPKDVPMSLFSVSAAPCLSSAFSEALSCEAAV